MFCVNCENEAVVVIPGVGEPLCLPCKKAYELGGSGHGPAIELQKGVGFDVTIKPRFSNDEFYFSDLAAKLLFDLDDPVLSELLGGNDSVLWFDGADGDRIEAVLHIKGIGFDREPIDEGA